MPEAQSHDGARSGATNLSELDVIRRTTRALRQLYHREKQWMASRTSDQTSRLTQQGQLSLSEQLHYGEIAFVLLRLKPCVIIDYAGDREQLDDYIANVIRPSLRDLNVLGAAVCDRNELACQTDGSVSCHEQQHAESNSAVYPRPFNLACSRISGQLESPEVSSWTGAYALYDTKWPHSAAWVKANLLNNEKTSISEDELAQGLDYPGFIPKTTDDMHAIVPVSYLGRMKSESGEWMCDRWECLTSFIVLQHQLPQMALHRIRYQAIKMFDIEMEVNMDTSLIEQFPNSLP
ncbi:hypothetical protein IW140_001824 [Coemansia sp. RSA 1813]|nr:hypothetical protein EV178_002544 [Coemansia sp. RSA 1646]KAJ1772435.1 hypothetical protein LPJ74_001526 [Coemansia sp. RSA 1843]KAJ2091154.1 hypothetical protein IW138_002117 [Coemansia sp. RSA 986]KAJ2213591.1 hypothetical protein EV179_003706 [Coemansia sp. RSA 487]KAJ2571122.1 hypothetical protein IW140_001824 [Coemansia sp. RSA 1813]